MITTLSHYFDDYALPPVLRHRDVGSASECLLSSLLAAICCRAAVFHMLDYARDFTLLS